MTNNITNIVRNLFKTIGAIIIIFLFSIWFIGSDYPQIIKNRYFTGPINNYMNVSIGDTRAEVLYKLGRPPYVFGPLNGCTDDKPWKCDRIVYSTDEKSLDSAKIDKDIKFYEIYEYEKYDGLKNSFMISFDKNNEVRTITCLKFCDAVLGINLNSDESDLRRFLGDPSISEVSADSGIKTISYRKFNLTFYLTKMKVYLIRIGPDDRFS